MLNQVEASINDKLNSRACPRLVSSPAGMFPQYGLSYLYKWWLVKTPATVYIMTRLYKLFLHRQFYQTSGIFYTQFSQ
jgi:hypothetical protein